MNRVINAAMTAAALPFAAFPLAFGGALPVATAQLIPDGPATVLHHGPTPWSVPQSLDGALCKTPKVCREVFYQWIVPLGLVEIGVDENVRRLDNAIRNLPSGPTAPDKIVFAFSGGARVASVWLKDHGSDHENDTAAPSPDDLSFVLTGNGGRRYGGLNSWWYGDALLTPTDTEYAVVDVAREYDPISDFPTNPFNLLAMANAIAGFQYLHMKYDDVDLDDPDNIVWTEGKTTYVHVPTENLPLLQGFRDAGLGWLVDDWEAPLREIIDQAYDRTWLDGKAPQGAEGDAQLRTLLADSSSRATMSLDVGEASLDSGTVDSAGQKLNASDDDPAAEESSDAGDPSTGIEDDGAQEDGAQDDGAQDDERDEGTQDDEQDAYTQAADDAAAAKSTGPKHRAPLKGVTNSVAASDSVGQADAATSASEDSADTGDGGDAGGADE